MAGVPTWNDTADDYQDDGYGTGQSRIYVIEYDDLDEVIVHSANTAVIEIAHRLEPFDPSMLQIKALDRFGGDVLWTAAGLVGIPLWIAMAILARSLRRPAA